MLDFRKIIGNDTNILKSIVFLYTHNKWLEKAVFKTIIFTVTHTKPTN